MGKDGREGKEEEREAEGKGRWERYSTLGLAEA